MHDDGVTADYTKGLHQAGFVNIEHTHEPARSLYLYPARIAELGVIACLGDDINIETQRILQALEVGDEVGVVIGKGAIVGVGEQINNLLGQKPG